jgi:MEMO1 family protein
MTIFPRLRQVEMFPAEVEGKQVICLRDPTGLTSRIAFLPPPAAFLVSLCDGTRTVADVASDFSKRTGQQATPALVEHLLGQLDEALFLDSPRLHAHRTALIDGFHASPRREAAHAGASYPGKLADLRAFLEGFRAGPVDALPDPEPGAPVGLVAPHIDFGRGGAAYAAAYAALPDGAARPDLVIVFGTDHNGARHPFTLTRKGYETPLGVVETDADLVDALAKEHGPTLFADEFHHRGEHSIEFQTVWLRHRYGERTPPILPILCGSLHEHVEGRTSPMTSAPVRAVLDSLRRLTAGRRVLVIAGADLAHVGPRFGDGPMSDPERATCKEADELSLRAVAAGDAEGFFRFVSLEDDQRRICGLSPIYATLALLEGRRREGKLLAYDQCDADDQGTSFVSIASMSL